MVTLLLVWAFYEIYIIIWLLIDVIESGWEDTVLSLSYSRFILSTELHMFFQKLEMSVLWGQFFIILMILICIVIWSWALCTLTINKSPYVILKISPFFFFKSFNILFPTIHSLFHLFYRFWSSAADLRCLHHRLRLPRS